MKILGAYRMNATRDIEDAQTYELEQVSFWLAQLRLTSAKHKTTELAFYAERREFGRETMWIIRIEDAHRANTNLWVHSICVQGTPKYWQV